MHRPAGSAATLIGGLLLAALPAEAAIPAGERNALIALYDATGGPAWADSSGWLGAPGTECTWYGVGCDDDGTTVTAISMGSNNLAGPLPEAIGNLPGLREVYLGENEITGPLPEEIGQLANLESLQLHRNRIDGSIPSALGNLKNLRVLSLFENRLDGAIPSGLAGATALEELVLTTNSLSGPIPAGLASLTNLKRLELSENELTGPIPTQLGSLAALEVLRLDTNALTGAIPPSLGSLPALRELVLAQNALTGAIPPALGNLATLELLDLDLNLLTGSIPAALGDLRNLRHLFLYDNALSGTIPAELFGITTLESLVLPANELSGTIPAQIATLSSLTNLSLWGNQLEGEIPEDIGALSNLEIVELHENALSGPVPGTLGQLTHLRDLNLGTNQLTGAIPDALADLTNLESLSLELNQLEGPIPSDLGRLTKLQAIRLGGNALSGPIPDAFAELRELRTLSLHTNQLDGALPAWLGQLSHLEEITLGDNRFTGVIPASITDLAFLSYLDLGRNRLTGGIPADFGRLQSLAYLTLEGNLLEGPLPPGFFTLTNLVDARLADLDLEGVLAPAVGDMKQLLNLDLENNRISGTIPARIGELTEIQYLSLDGNRLTGAIPPEIGSLTNVLEMDLSNNDLRGAVPPELMNLTALLEGRLDIGFNALTTNDAALRTFLNAKHHDGDFEATQTLTPTGLRITAVTDRSVVAEWTPIRYLGDDGGYRLEASTSPGGSPVAVATTASKEITTATIRGLSPSRTYYVTVAAVTHPHGYQRNLVASERSAAVTATTSLPVVAPADIAMTAAPKGLVQIDGEPVGTDSFALSNFGDVATELTLEAEGGFFTVTPSHFTLHGGATQVVTLTSVGGQPADTYWGVVFAEGDGVPEEFHVTVTLLSVTRPAGTVVAEAVTSRIELSGAPGTDSVGTARFRNTGTARLTGVLVSDVAWIEVPNEPVGIDPGSIGTINFTVVRSRRPPGDGALTGTLRLVYVDGGSEGASILDARIQNGSTGVSTTLVTVIDVLRPQTGSSPIPPLAPGEVAFFAPGLPSVLVGNRLASTVAIANSYGASPITDLRAYYSQAGAAQVAVATLGSIGSSTAVTLANVVPNVFGSTAPQIGTLQFRTRDWRSVVLQGRLLGLADDARSTIGETPVFRSDRSLGPGEAGYLTGLAKSSPMSTDLHVQEAAGEPAAANIDFLDAGGTAIGDPLTVSLEAFGSAALEDAVPAGAVTAVVTHSGSSGRLIAYGRIVSGPGGDQWTSVDSGRASGFALDEAARIPLVESSSGGSARRRPVRHPGDGGSNATAGSATATALWLFNPAATDAIVRLELVDAAGRSERLDLTVGPQATLHLQDVVRSVRGSAGRGSLRIVPLRGGIVAAARTERTEQGALHSITSLPLVRDTAGLRVGQIQRFAALADPTIATVDAKTAGTFRTGFGFVETSGQPVTIRASVWLHDGRSPVSQRLGRDFTLEPNEILVADRLGRALFGESRDVALPDLHDLQVEFEVISGSGSALPFVVITDNASGDALLRVE